VELVAGGKLSIANRLTETIINDKMAELRMPATLELQGLPAPGDTLENKDITARVAGWLRLSLFSSLVTQGQGQQQTRPVRPAASSFADGSSPARETKLRLVLSANAQTALAEPWTAASGRAASPHPLPNEENSSCSVVQHADPGTWPARADGCTTDELPRLAAQQLGRFIAKDPFEQQRVTAWRREDRRLHHVASATQQQQIAATVVRDGAVEAAVADVLAATSPLSLPSATSASQLFGEAGKAGAASTGFRKMNPSDHQTLAKFLSVGLKPAFPMRDDVEEPGADPPWSGDILARNFHDVTFRDTTNPGASSASPYQAPSQSISNRTAAVFAEAKDLVLQSRSELGALSVMASALHKEVGRQQEVLEMMQFEAMKREGEDEQAAQLLAGISERIAIWSNRLDSVGQRTAEVLRARQEILHMVPKS
jgi:hypothetical protein